MSVGLAGFTKTLHLLSVFLSNASLLRHSHQRTFLLPFAYLNLFSFWTLCGTPTWPCFRLVSLYMQSRCFRYSTFYSSVSLCGWSLVNCPERFNGKNIVLLASYYASSPKRLYRLFFPSWKLFRRIT